MIINLEEMSLKEMKDHNKVPCTYDGDDCLNLDNYDVSIAIDNMTKGVLNVDRKYRFAYIEHNERYCFGLVLCGIHAFDNHAAPIILRVGLLDA